MRNTIDEINFDAGSLEWVNQIENLERKYRKEQRAKTTAYVYVLWKNYAPKDEQKSFKEISNMVNYSLLVFEDNELDEINNIAKKILKTNYNIEIK